MGLFKRDKGLVGSVNVRTGDAEPEDGGKVIPSLGRQLRLRRVHEDEVEDLAGVRYTVWRVAGCDISDPKSEAGWMSFLNNLEFPVQILVRQHAPDYSGFRSQAIEDRPEDMREGFVNKVGNSLLDMLHRVEEEGGVVAREWYVVARSDRHIEVAAALSQGGFDASLMTTDDLGLLLQACCSGMGYGHTQSRFQMRASPSELELNYRFASVYEVVRWPRRATPLFLEGLLRTGEELDLSLWVWPVSNRESNSRLQTQRSRFEGARLSDVQRGRLVRPEVDQAIADVTRVAESVERGDNRLFRRTMSIALFSPTRQGLRDAHEKLIGHFRSSIARVLRLKFRQLQGFSCVMPALRRGLLPDDLTDGETMLRMFPFGPPDLDRREGVLLGLDMRSRTMVFHDAFKPDALNGHMVLMARSGAGKSFSVKLRTVRETLRGMRCYIIDPEGEYSILAKTLGGEVFIPGSPGYGLNPFVVTYRGMGALSNRVSSLGSLLQMMLEGEADQDLKASIDACLMKFYLEQKEELGGRNPVLGQGGIAEFHRFLESGAAARRGGERLAHLLSPFSTGSAQFLLRSDVRDLLEHEAPVTAFNLRNLPPRLKAVATAVCTEVVWGLAISDPRPRLLIVDECWTVLATRSGAEALLTVAKRARKYRLGLMAITQDVQDFLAEDTSAGAIQGHAGKSLLQNSAMKLLLQQDPAALPLVVSALGLTDDAAAFLASSLRGQGLLVGERGDCYPLDILSTEEERSVLLDRSWVQLGDLNEDRYGDDADEDDDIVWEGRSQEELLDELSNRVVRERAEALA